MAVVCAVSFPGTFDCYVASQNKQYLSVLRIQGDNDPVDVVEIGSEQLESGKVYKVKVLGAYAMIDEGELDWKIVAIREDDLMARHLQDIDDVERLVILTSLLCSVSCAESCCSCLVLSLDWRHHCQWRMWCAVCHVSMLPSESQNNRKRMLWSWPTSSRAADSKYGHEPYLQPK